MEKHTPGPWRAVNHHGIFDVMAEPNGVCRVSEMFDPAINTAGKPDTKEQAANARLIAAAPDLLAALERTEEILLGGDPVETSEPWCQDLVMGTIRPAIARARGES